LLVENLQSSVCKLPVTPFHYPLASLISRLDGRLSLSLPGLIVGSMVPDLEIPFVFLFSGQDRLVLHSLIGGLTLGTFVSVVLTVLVYPRLTSAVFPIDGVRVKEKCRLSFGVGFSCFVGCLSHVLLDVVNHPFSPVFWPFLSAGQTPSPIVPLLGGEFVASVVVSGVMVAVFVVLFYNKRVDFWNHLLVE
jgi:membrane-bound metal-dependent hydrolase YbcI (DUF457 family)